MEAGAQPTGVPRSLFDIEYQDTVKSGELPPGSFWLVNKETRERKKIDVSAYGYAKQPEFVSDYVIKIPAVRLVSQWSGQPDVHFLYAVMPDGGKFLRNEKTGQFKFPGTISVYDPGFVSADGNLFHPQGYLICSNYWINLYKNAYRIQCTGQQEGGGFQFYNRSGERLSMKMPGATKVHDLNKLLAYFWADTVFLFDIAANQEKGKFLTVPQKIRDAFYKTRFEPAIDKLFDADRMIPIMVGREQWTYANDQGLMAFKPVAADMAFPFMFPNNQAPVHYRNKWGLINKEGKMTYSFQFDSLVLGTSYSTTQLRRNDSVYKVNAQGMVVPWNTPDQKPVASSQTNATTYKHACLVYIFEKENDYNSKAYILVTLAYKPEKLDHAMMVQWVKGAMASEVMNLRERGYIRSRSRVSNQYDADAIYEGEGCYGREAEYKQRSSWVTIFEKVFN